MVAERSLGRKDALHIAMTCQDLTAERLHDMPLPKVQGEMDKEARGRVLVAGGGREVPGAAYLCALAAYRAGAGKVRIAACDALALPLALALPEARVLTVPANDQGEPSPEAAEALRSSVEQGQAVVVGPGMIDEKGAAALAAALVAMDTTAGFLIDAGALTGLAGRTQALAPAAGRLVLTPHAGETAKLCGIDKASVEADPAGVARRIAAEWSAVVALKGQTTFIAAPDGQVFRHVGEANGLGVSGSGDVLAGTIAGLLARGAEPLTAALWGVFAHGQAGRRLSERVGLLGFLAREVADELPRVLYA